MSQSSDDMDVILAQIQQLEIDEEARKQRRRAEEEATRKFLEEEATRQFFEQEKKQQAESKRRMEAARAAAGAEARQQQIRAEEEASRKFLEEEATRQFLEREKKQQAESKRRVEAARAAAEVEARQQQIRAEEEASRKFLEEEARLLQFSIRKPASPPPQAIPLLTDEEREKLQILLSKPAVLGERNPDGSVKLDTSAHAYTHDYIKDGIPILIGINDRLKLSSPDLTPDQVEQQVLEFLNKHSKEIAELAKRPEYADFLRITGGNLQKAITNIRTTFVHVRSKPAVDAAETRAHAHYLLSRTWTLAESMGSQRTIAMAAIAVQLSDNIGDDGKCIPGLIARLYSPCAKLTAIRTGVAIPDAAVAVAAPKPGGK